MFFLIHSIFLQPLFISAVETVESEDIRMKSPSKEELKRIAAEANAKLHALCKKIGDNGRKPAIKKISDVEIHSQPPDVEQLIEKTPSKKHKNDQDVDALVKPNSSLNQLYGRYFQGEPVSFFLTFESILCS